MPEDGSLTIDRRTVLKQTAAAGAALTVGSGVASAATETLDVEVWISDVLAQEDHEDMVRAAADDIEAHSNVEVNFVQFQETDSVYGGDPGDIYDDFQSEEGWDINEGQVNLLIFNDAPLSSDVTGCNHNNVELKPDTEPLAILNGWFTGLPDQTYKNLIITAMLRPVLEGQMWRAPVDGDINSFGVIHTDMGFTNEASPLASWHEPRRAWCPSPADIDDAVGSGDDHLDGMCGSKTDPLWDATDDVPKACDHTGRLSECTAEAIEDQIAGEFN